jgi:hypothetical protein
MLRAQYQERGNRSQAESDKSTMELCSLFRGAALLPGDNPNMDRRDRRRIHGSA